MTSEVNSACAPRIIAHTRNELAFALRRQLHIAFRRFVRRVAIIRKRLAERSQHHRELELLMHADDRLLADIGLTRFDVVVTAQESRGLFGRRDALNAAAARRDEAIAVSQERRDYLRHTQAPALVPALPCVVETSNFR